MLNKAFFHLLVFFWFAALLKNPLLPSGLPVLVFTTAYMVCMNYCYYICCFWVAAPRLISSCCATPWAIGWSYPLSLIELKFFERVWFNDAAWLFNCKGRLFWNLISCYFFIVFIFACYCCIISGSWILYWSSEMTLLLPSMFFVDCLPDWPTPKVFDFVFEALSKNWLG